MPFLDEGQLEAIGNLKNGNILCGEVGTGKSRVSIAYYFLQNGGRIKDDKINKLISSDAQDLYIITTATKRDKGEWEIELLPFHLTAGKDEVTPWKTTEIHIDSWNNIAKYISVKGAFFIFDEKRVNGSGPWATAFIRIARNNNWIMLSATPGDHWIDYAPVFIANGFYRNFTEFKNEHVTYKPFKNHPEVDHDKYRNTDKLNYYKRSILVDIPLERHTVPHHIDMFANYDRIIYRSITKDRRNPYTNEPITNATEYCLALRKVVNSDESRQEMVLEILEDHPKVIIFYNYDYELDILRSLVYPDGTEVAEWNGHKHEPLPKGDKWVFLVNYMSGSEGWNCITTDTIIFYSQNYSYKTMKQAAGRIDRRNTKCKDLYYYHLKSKSSIDISISRTLDNKKKFNENKFFAKKFFPIVEINH